MSIEDFPLGSVPIDSAQSIRKAWDDDKKGHRVVGVNVDYNIVDYTYTGCGEVATAKYYYESIAESTKITTISDTSSSLNGQSFKLYSKDDAIEYRVLYSVAGATTAPSDTDILKYVLVNITVNDVAPVVSLATALAINTNSDASDDFTALASGEFLTITNDNKGTATNTVDIDTSFTFALVTQGTKELVETLSYKYDSENRIIKVTTASGENLLNIANPVGQVSSVDNEIRRESAVASNLKALEMQNIDLTDYAVIEDNEIISLCDGTLITET